MRWELSVYNRWGQLVWYGDDPDDYWELSDVSDGSYVYSLIASKRESSHVVSLSGHVMVLK